MIFGDLCNYTRAWHSINVLSLMGFNVLQNWDDINQKPLSQPNRQAARVRISRANKGTEEATFHSQHHSSSSPVSRGNANLRPPRFHTAGQRNEGGLMFHFVPFPVTGHQPPHAPLCLCWTSQWCSAAASRFNTNTRVRDTVTQTQGAERPSRRSINSTRWEPRGVRVPSII